MAVDATPEMAVDATPEMRLDSIAMQTEVTVVVGRCVITKARSGGQLFWICKTNKSNWTLPRVEFGRT